MMQGRHAESLLLLKLNEPKINSSFKAQWSFFCILDFFKKPIQLLSTFFFYM